MVVAIIQMRGRAIDGFVFLDKKQGFSLGCPKTLNWDHSDHIPVGVIAKLTLPTLIEESTASLGCGVREGGLRPKITIPQQVNQEQALAVLRHPFYKKMHDEASALRQVLEEEMQEDGVDHSFIDYSAKTFQDATNAVLLDPDLHLCKVPILAGQRRFFRVRISPAARRALRARSRWSSVMEESEEGSAAFEKARNKHIRAKDKCNKLLRFERHAREAKEIGQAIEACKNDPKAFWTWLQGNYGKGKHSGVVSLFDKATGKVTHDPIRVNQIMRAHFAKVMEGGDGAQMSKEYYMALWADTAASKGDAAFAQGGEALEQPIQGDELLAALRYLKNHKAPGEDGVPVEYFKLLLVAGDASDPEGIDVWQTPMGAELLEIINTVWSSGKLPKDWLNSTFVPIHKDGSTNDPNNYRPIALIPSTTKLLMTVLQLRLTRFCMQQNVISSLQGSAQENEECVAQTCLLYELCKRRATAAVGRVGDGHETWLLFVDLAKAFDSVQHQDLLAAAHAHGIRGRALTLLESLFEGATISVRTGEAPYQYSEPIRPGRGQLQGNPCSPLLYSLFMDGLADKLADGNGALLPASPGASPEVLSRRIDGVLFADDVAVCTPNEPTMKLRIGLLQKWADDHFQKFNVDKCGMMVTGRPNFKQELDAIPKEQRWWLLNGDESIPIVEEYKHLGSVFPASLDLQVVASARQKKGEAAARLVRSSLKRNVIPMHMRLLLVKVVVSSTMLFGTSMSPPCREKIRCMLSNPYRKPTQVGG